MCEDSATPSVDTDAGHTLSSRLAIYWEMSLAAENKHLETFIASQWTNPLNLVITHTHIFAFLFHVSSYLFFIIFYDVLEIKENKTKTNGPSPQKASHALCWRGGWVPEVGGAVESFHCRRSIQTLR